MKETVQKRPILPLACLLGLLLCPLASSNAREGDSVELQRKIFELERRIAELETELAHCRHTADVQSGPQYGWQNTKNWRRLEIGMPESQVKTILGEPVKVIKGVKVLWYYPNVYCGYVAFDRAGQLTGWNEP
jgi:hypothetical protein